MPVIIKPVKVKRSVYANETNAGITRQFIIDCVKMGSASSLYEDPNIGAAYYSAGTSAATAIQTAIDDYGNAPTTGNHNTIIDKADLGKIWLDGYADKVETIANADANRSTRIQAATNITLANLTPKQLVFSLKGIPATPIVRATTVGSGKIAAEITNGVDYKPSQTTFIVVEETAGASFTFVEGQLIIEMANKGQVVIKTRAMKAKYTNFTHLKSGVKYAIYAYSQNGKNQISDLSEPQFVNG
jgi:hypothetical protein